MPAEPYFVYILSNLRRTVLYVGMTRDLARRLRQHRNGGGSGFVRRYHATQLVYVEFFQDSGSARAREKQLKAGNRERKLALIKKLNPGWVNLIP